jgi:biopolymer transport protein ExbB
MQNNNSLGGNLKSLFAIIAIPVCIVVAILIYMYLLGNPANFVGGLTENAPVDKSPNHWFATIHKGGIIVPIIIGLLLIVITFSIERLLTLSRAKGRGSVDGFLRRIKVLLSNNDIAAASRECDKQRGSIANVVKSGLVRYQQVFNAPDMDKEQKMVAIQKELEEATTLELPMLEKNLVVLATVASIATLLGLLGTVIGMIRAFSALANAGAPDTSALSLGISEALINTALGIGTSAIAIILYNTFTNIIDSTTYKIDEAGFSIAQTFAEHYKEGAVLTTSK